MTVSDITAAPDRRGRPLTLDDLLAVRTPCSQHRVALSPDGRYLACALRREAQQVSLPESAFPTGASGTAAGAQVWVMDLARGTSWPLLGEEGRSWRPSWSPDGACLAFYADHGGAAHLWRWQPATGETRRVADAAIFSSAFSLDTPRWSPDSSRVYVPLRPPEWQPRAPGATMAAAGSTGATAAEPAVDVLVSHRAPRASPVVAPPAPQRSQDFRDVGVVEMAAGRTERLLTGFPALAFFPSPDGRWLAIVTLGSRPDMGRYGFVTDLYLLPAGGGTPRLLAEGLDSTGSGRHAPAWSPDSAHVAYIRRGQLWIASPEPPEPAQQDAARHVPVDAELDERMLLWHPGGGALLARERGGRLWLAPAVEQPAPEPRPLGLAAGRSAAVLQRIETTWFWNPGAPAGESCAVCTRDPESGRGEFWRVPLDGSPAELLVAEERTFTVTPLSPIGSYWGDVSADGGTVVYAAEDEAHPPEFWAAGATFQDRRQVTQLNPHLDEVGLGRAQMITWPTTEGQQVRGALLVPPNHETGRRAPLVANVYPGLSLSGELRRWEASASGILHLQLLCSRGYVVLLPDIPSTAVDRRGGEPLPLTRAGLAGAVLPGVNEAVRLGIADPDRLGVMGHSGGGAAVNRLITETARFKAAVSAAGAANAASFFGQLRVRPGGTPEMDWVHLVEGLCGGPPWAAPLRYVMESPVFFLDRVETPLLLIHGTEDVAGVEQSGEMFVGLCRLGKEVTFLRYRGEGHNPIHFGEANRRDVVRRVLAWFDQHLGVGEAANGTGNP